MKTPWSKPSDPASTQPTTAQAEAATKARAPLAEMFSGARRLSENELLQGSPGLTPGLSRHTPAPSPESAAALLARSLGNGALAPSGKGGFQVKPYGQPETDLAMEKAQARDLEPKLLPASELVEREHRFTGLCRQAIMVPVFLAVAMTGMGLKGQDAAHGTTPKAGALQAKTAQVEVKTAHPDKHPDRIEVGHGDTDHKALFNGVLKTIRELGLAKTDPDANTGAKVLCLEKIASWDKADDPLVKDGVHPGHFAHEQGVHSFTLNSDMIKAVYVTFHASLGEDAAPTAPSAPKAPSAPSAVGGAGLQGPEGSTVKVTSKTTTFTATFKGAVPDKEKLSPDEMLKQFPNALGDNNFATVQYEASQREAVAKNLIKDSN